MHKKVAAKRVTKKKPAKIAYSKGSMVGKLLQLKYRINDAYNNETKADSETRADKNYVMTLINEVRENPKTFTKLCKEDFEKCNGLWKTYE